MKDDQPWKNEPDVKQWVEDSGLRCSIRRHGHLGTLCGYVDVPPEHPWHGKDHRDLVEPISDELSEVCQPVIPMLLFALKPQEPGDTREPLELAVKVHGGLTYAAPSTEPKGWWCFGFDCAHAYDWLPRMEGLIPRYGTYRDMDYVTGEVSRLAAQLRLVKP